MKYTNDLKRPDGLGSKSDRAYGDFVMSTTLRTARRAGYRTRPQKKAEGKVETATRSDWVRRQIADEIISGTLRPGQELDEKKLADAFKVSRTPVREALRQLSAANLVDWLPHQTAVVSKVSPSKMVEMFEVMADLEGFCGRLAARRMTAAEHSNLLSIHKKFKPFVQAGNREGYHALNKSFHRAIYAGSHNEYLRDLASGLYDRLAPYRAFQLRRPDALRLASEEHQAIIEAIISADGNEARRLLMDHVSLSNELFADLVAALSATDSNATPPKS
jgi:DNA-binding GntR family transcriptional regulator